MKWRNTSENFGAMSKIFHWILAVLIIAMFALGFYMTSLFPPDLSLYSLHKSFGILVLILVVLRAIWSLSNVAPKLLSVKKSWEKLVARLVHSFLYVAMLGMPLSGWLMSSSHGYPVKFFGLFTLPKLMDKQPKESFWQEFWEETHEILGYLLIATLVLHVAAALKHHFVLKDRTLTRMLPGRRSLVIGFMVLVSFYGSNEAQARQISPPQMTAWQVDYSKSSVTFSGKQMGALFQGRFLKYQADILFEPDHLSDSSAVVRFDINGLDTQLIERDVTLKGSFWFQVDQYPQAIFTSRHFKRLSINDYEVTGDLKILGQNNEVSFPFHLKFLSHKGQQRQVEMTAAFTLDRLALNLGQGDWADSSIIGQYVPVKLHVLATAL